MLPKPPKRIRSPEACDRFCAIHPWCQICGTPDGLQIHHMGDLDCHRRSDIPENMMRLCYACHDLFHAAARWSKTELRELRTFDQHILRYEYEERETYNGDQA